ncbi:MAG: site-specific integrase [Candidatus Sulfotelmatobacter sp.]|jgi:integrase
MSPRRQEGTLFAIGDTCYLKYRITELKDGTPRRVHKTIRLCEKSDLYTWWKKKNKWGFSSAVQDLRSEKMAELRTQIERAEPSDGNPSSDMRVVDFWGRVYLPHLEEIVTLTGQPRRKPSTVRGFKQIWNQHLKTHFADITLKAYEPMIGNRFLRTLTSTQGKSTLKHIKALGSSIFGHAVEEEIIKLNPWREVKIPKDAIESEATQHYTLEEAEDIISALVDHVDCQLVMALACFLGLRPGEIAALKWEDFNDDTVSIRRSVVRGIVGTPKTPESLATLPLPMQVKIPLELWRQKSQKESGETSQTATQREGYVFESKNGTPVDLHNMISRVIVPHVNGGRKCVVCDKTPKALKGVKWKTLYAGRRGAATAVIEANNGNLAIGQALLRHKSQITTATFYKKAVTPETLRNGMKMLELAASTGSQGK